jgi:hypothetical protein
MNIPDFPLGIEGTLMGLLKTCLQFIAFSAAVLLGLALFIILWCCFSEQKSPN